MNKPIVIDALQYVNWNRALFEELHASSMDAVHVTIAYWENTEEVRSNVALWREHFRDNADLIMPILSGSDLRAAQKSNRVGIIFGFQNCSPIEDALAKVQTMHDLGARVMQLSYNNQSLLATGCYEEGDSGITRFGREVIREMNKVGMLIDMSHSAEHSTLQAIEFSERPIAITHANPSFFHPALRNKSNAVLEALSASGGMLGCSLYPFHLKNGTDCTLQEFSEMIARTVDLMGIDCVGIGSDLCLNWGYEVLEWMRSGRWAAQADFGEGSASNADWPAQPDWFARFADIDNIASGLLEVGFNQEETNKLMGENWFQFFDQSFSAT
ncbi:MAG: membrane dipeptidase [Pseudomonadales bacterium]